MQLRLLDAVDEVCKKHNLSYWLDYGTLLGAVRNGKFIPWDDDIDISMSKEDHQKFLKIAQKEFPNDIFLQTHDTDPAYRQMMTKVRDCNSTFIENHEEEGTAYHQGIFIDIFPSEKYPKMPKLFRKVLMRTTVRSRYGAYVHREKLLLNIPVYFFCKLVWFFVLALPKHGYGMVPEDNGYMFSVPLEHLHPLTTIEFEGTQYPVPKNYHAHLKVIYGDTYMTPPEESYRVPHAKRILLDTPCKHPRSIPVTPDSN
jgi:lipopolysaccharide cholinephosphotransferase